MHSWYPSRRALLCLTFRPVHSRQIVFLELIDYILTRVAWQTPESNEICVAAADIEPSWPRTTQRKLIYFQHILRAWRLRSDGSRQRQLFLRGCQTSAALHLLCRRDPLAGWDPEWRGETGVTAACAQITAFADSTWHRLSDFSCSYSFFCFPPLVFCFGYRYT